MLPCHGHAMAMPNTAGLALHAAFACGQQALERRRLDWLAAQLHYTLHLGG